MLSYQYIAICFLMTLLTCGTMQWIPSTGLSCTTGHSTDSRQTHPQYTYTFTLIFSTSHQSRSPPPISYTNRWLTFNYTFQRFSWHYHCFSSAEANHCSRSALSNLSFRIGAGENVCFSNFAENKKSNQKLVLFLGIWNTKADHNRT